ncbi:MAG: phasin family protein [Halomonas sp.]|nr:phasin family protein [Halomonas sp.]
MQQDQFFKTFTEQTRGFFEPMRKINGLMLDNMEKMTQFQLESMKRYSQLGTERLRAASEVKDVEDLQSFTARQTELLSELSQQMMDDARAMTELSLAFRESLEKAFADAGQQALDQAGAAARQADDTSRSASNTSGKSSSSASSSRSKNS